MYASESAPPSAPAHCRNTTVLDLSNRYTTSGGRGGGMGVEAAGASEPIRITNAENCFVNIGMMEQQ